MVKDRRAEFILILGSFQLIVDESMSRSAAESVHRGGVSRGRVRVVSNMLQVTGDTGHLTRNTCHLTPD